MKAFRSFRFGPVLALLSCVLLQPAYALDWSRTELHFQYGNLAVPTFAGGGDAEHFIYTLQHASGWKYGDNYFFVDTLDARNSEFQDFDTYGEWYANLSLGKITGRKIGAGIVSDVGVILGFNWARKPGIKKYLPGLRLSLDLGGFYGDFPLTLPSPTCIDRRHRVRQSGLHGVYRRQRRRLLRRCAERRRLVHD